MTTHILHADPLVAGLCDDCPRCQEHAMHPTTLDIDVQTRLAVGELLTDLDAVAAERLRAEMAYEAGLRMCVACGEALDEDEYVVTSKGWYHVGHYVPEVHA
jgi:hypothetical protein